MQMSWLTSENANHMSASIILIILKHVCKIESWQWAGKCRHSL